MKPARIPASDLQKAIYDRLKLDHPAWNVFTWIPGRNQAFPYVILGVFNAMDSSDKTEATWRIDYTINVWSQSQGTAEVNSLMDGVFTSMVRDALVMANDWTVNYMTLISSDVGPEFGDEIGPLQHGVIRLQFLVSDDRISA